MSNSTDNTEYNGQTPTYGAITGGMSYGAAATGLAIVASTLAAGAILYKGKNIAKTLEHALPKEVVGSMLRTIRTGIEDPHIMSRASKESNHALQLITTSSEEAVTALKKTLGENKPTLQQVKDLVVETRDLVTKKIDKITGKSDDYMKELRSEASHILDNIVDAVGYELPNSVTIDHLTNMVKALNNDKHLEDTLNWSKYVVAGATGVGAAYGSNVGKRYAENQKAEFDARKHEIAALRNEIGHAKALAEKASASKEQGRS